MFDEAVRNLQRRSTINHNKQHYVAGQETGKGKKKINHRNFSNLQEIAAIAAKDESSCLTKNR